MKKALIQKMLPAMLASIVTGSAHAAPTYDPTFVANVQSYHTRKIMLASDGGYFLSSTLSSLTYLESIPCSPTHVTQLNIPGYDQPFRTPGTHFLYPTLKLTEEGRMDCNFKLLAGYPAAQGILPDGDGKIYAFGDGPGLMLYDAQIGGRLQSYYPYHIARFSEANGQLDNEVILGSVSGTGQFIGGFIPFSTMGLAYNDTRAAALDKNGPSTKLVLGGLHQYSAGGDYASVWRLNADGSWDDSFVPLHLNDPVNARNVQIRKIQVLPSGKILVGGAFTKTEGLPYGRFIQLNADGTLDTAFMANLTDNGNREMGGSAVNDFVVQPDGKIILTGVFYLRTGIATLTYHNLMRLNQDGSLDESFNPPSNVMRSATNINTVALQGDGRVILAANASYNFASGLSQLMRLNADGSMDDTFRVRFETGWPYYQNTYAAAFDSECRLVVAFGGGGNETTPTLEFPLTGEVTPPVTGLVRLLVDGAAGCVY